VGDIYWIGDVHGCFKTLKALLKQIPQGAKIGFLGDLNDRGIDSLGVIKLAMRRGSYFLFGNHESIMSEALFFPEELGNEQLWRQAGGNPFIAQLDALSKGKRKKAIKTITDYLERCQAFYTCDKYIAAHAGIPYTFDDSINPQFYPKFVHSDLMWTKSFESSELYAEKHNKQVILGHHWFSKEDVRIKDNVVVLDTSCVAGGCLTAFNPITGDLIHQDMLDS